MLFNSKITALTNQIVQLEARLKAVGKTVPARPHRSGLFTEQISALRMHVADLTHLLPKDSVPKPAIADAAATVMKGLFQPPRGPVPPSAPKASAIATAPPRQCSPHTEQREQCLARFAHFQQLKANGQDNEATDYFRKHHAEIKAGTTYAKHHRTGIILGKIRGSKSQ